MDAQTTRKHGAWVLLIVGIGLGTCLFSAVESMAEEAARPTRSVLGGAASGASSASGKDAGVERKLDQILANQETILQRFDQVMEELRIIKVRSTSRGGS